MPIDRGDDQLRSIFQARQRLVSEQRKMIAEFGGLPGKHVDVGARAEKLFARAAKHQHMNVRIEAGLQDRVIQLLEAFKRVGVGGRVVQFHDRDAVLYPIVNQCHKFSKTRE